MKVLIYTGVACSVFVLFALIGIAGIIRQPQSEKALSAPSRSFMPEGYAEYASAVATAPSLIGKVIAVADGDTIVVLDDKKKEHKVRLAGIDAPEFSQDFGNKAKQNLWGLVFGKFVEVYGDKIDKYGRLVGKIIVGGVDVNLEQVKSGFAWHYKEYESEQSESDRKSYSTAELTARASKSNLWSMPTPMPPWDFRHGGTIDPSLKSKIFGNKNSFKYHWSDCPGFARIAEKNRVVFDSWQEAEAAGYVAALNCKGPKPESKAETIEEIPELDSTMVGNAPAPVYVEPQPRYIAPAPVPVYRETYSAPAERYSAPPPRYTPQETVEPTITAICRDGTVSYSASRSGTCSSHGGVSSWTDESAPSRPAAVPVYSAPSYPAMPDYRPKTVQVRGYTRKDGTYVAPHTRRAPRRN